MKPKTLSKISLAFFFLTLFPTTILCFLALSSLDKEPVYMEQQWRSEVQEEVNFVHRSINTLLKRMHQDIIQALLDNPSQSSYVEKAFVLSSTKDLIYPVEGIPEIESFFKDKESIPLYASGVAESYTFSDILQKSNNGIVPRMTQGGLQLIFWMRQEDGQIRGCLINLNYLKNEIENILLRLTNHQRLLTVLNEHALPITSSLNTQERDWRQADISKEITRVLPNWRIAAYIINPQERYSQLVMVTRTIRVIVILMLLIIAVGGIVVVHLLMEKVRLAQQKEAFATNVSHELKTPLTSIQMFTQMLLQHKEVSVEKRQEYLEFIDAESKRLGRLIHRILDFASLDKKPYKKEVIDFIALSQNTVESQRLRLELEGFNLNFKTLPESVLVFADPDAVEQCVLNLLSNSQKYSFKQKDISITIHTEDKFVMMDIKDKGIGVAQDKSEQIFEEFYRVEDPLNGKTEGAGLGLTISRRILRDHQGDLLCMSFEGGAWFRIQLPIHGV